MRAEMTVFVAVVSLACAVYLLVALVRPELF